MPEPSRAEVEAAGLWLAEEAWLKYRAENPLVRDGERYSFKIGFMRGMTEATVAAAKMVKPALEREP